MYNAFWGRLGFDVGYEAAQGMPRSSYLVNPLENYTRQRRALRSSRLIPARRCTDLLMGQAGKGDESLLDRCSVIYISLSARSGRLAVRIRRSGWLSVSLPAGGRKARPK